MYQRMFNYSKSHSFFLFGARATGKTTLIKNLFPIDQYLWIDLLRPDIEERYMLAPSRLREEYLAFPEDKKPKTIIVDEIQKLPKLLDVVHSMIEEFHIRFILTGSSARKLKIKGANLLAGRAFEYHLFPLSMFEIGSDFELEKSLRYGLLPSIWTMNDEEDQKDYLRSYVQKYLKEEIQLEQLVKDPAPFRKFLEVAATSNAEIINYSKLGRVAGVDSKSVERYFELLADTFIGFFLNSFDRSIRARQIKSPKFYFFDTGVIRSLNHQLNLEISPSTYGYGKIFETFVINEFVKLNSLYKKDFRFSYMKTKDGPEIDLIIERPGKELLLIEIKSTSAVTTDDYRSLINLGADLHGSEKMVLSLDRSHRVVDDIEIVYFFDGIKKIFEL